MFIQHFDYLRKSAKLGIAKSRLRCSPIGVSPKEDVPVEDNLVQITIEIFKVVNALKHMILSINPRCCIATHVQVLKFGPLRSRTQHLTKGKCIS